MNKKLLIIVSLVLIVVSTNGQGFTNAWLDQYIHINYCTLIVETHSDSIPTIIIDSNGRRMLANAEALFSLLDFNDSTKEVLLSPFEIFSIFLYDATTKEPVFPEPIYNSIAGIPPPEGLSEYERDELICKVEDAFNIERTNWNMYVYKNRTRKDLEDSTIGTRRGSLRCWVIM